jgi:hypothetical protein
MAGKNKTGNKSADDDNREGSPYLLQAEKKVVLRWVGLINKQYMKTDEWIKDNCVQFNGRNHLSAFIYYLNDEFPADEPPRMKCNKKDITKVQLRNWIQTARSRAKEINKIKKDDPTFTPIPLLGFVQDGAKTEAEKKADAKRRKLERMAADSDFLRGLVG